tara:strand:- start:946 stop:3261 length:2316 start_codon:yes stop_codon:yes gene_type:complete
MKNYINILSKKIVLASLLGSFGLNLIAQEVEEVVVTAEKRSESLQDISQAVTALTELDIEEKNITSFVDLSAIVPGVTVAKNEGYKTVISIRGVGNETNQNAIAAPSVAFHMDGVFIASPFALGTDFLDVERIEVLRGPQGTLFGQNSTGGAVNVISKAPSTEGDSGKLNVTFGDYDLKKITTSNNFVVNEKIATRFSLSSTTREGFSKNIVTGQDLDDANNKSFRTDWMFDLNDTSSLRVFGQYFKVDRNGAAIRGIDDQTPGMRKLSQDTVSQHELSSMVVAAIYESDLGFANLKAIASVQEDDILVVRDNDRHNYLDLVLAIPDLGLGATYQRAEFTPETSLVDTKTLEINLISNEPLEGRLDWTVGLFYMDHEIENHIRGYRDDDFDGVIKYLCGETFADPAYCYDHDYEFPGSFDIFGPDAEVDFFTDSFPGRESFSLYGQGTLNISETLRVISGLRYSRDTFTTDVTNFLNVESFQEEGTTDEITSRVVAEFDISEDVMLYVGIARGFKPGGSNLTFGFDDDNAPPMVFPTFESETVESVELGLKSTFADGRARANLAAFSYVYENLQFQATDPDIYRGGVANIPESEMSGLEIEFTGYLSDSFSVDMNLAFLNSEVTSDYEVLDNVDAYPYFFGEEDIRYGLRENVKGNSLAKTPELTADISLKYETNLSSGRSLQTILQFIKRGDFQQRVSNNPIVDYVRDYQIGNMITTLGISEGLSIDFMLLNITDEVGVNSSMTDVFGVAATGLELIPPRQAMTRLRYKF